MPQATQGITRAELDAELAHATGSEEFTAHWTRAACYTSGVEAMAERAGAYWLIDAIASHLRHSPKASIKRAPFQVWTLHPHREGSGATLMMQEDTGTPMLVRQIIEFTDFPLEGQPFKLYACANGHDTVPTTILLPSEY